MTAAPTPPPPTPLHHAVPPPPRGCVGVGGDWRDPAIQICGKPPDPQICHPPGGGGGGAIRHPPTQLPQAKCITKGTLP